MNSSNLQQNFPVWVATANPESATKTEDVHHNNATEPGPQTSSLMTKTEALLPDNGFPRDLSDSKCQENVQKVVCCSFALTFLGVLKLL